MERKETAAKNDLLFVIDMLNEMRIRYWLVGGWGVDVLAGGQHREHRDIDINFDERYTDELVERLLEAGYTADTDWRPIRIELYSDKYGYIDIHPFAVDDDGSARKYGPNGEVWEFEPDYFGACEFEGKMIPCLTVKGQMAFHSGYELQGKDEHDIFLLNSLK